MLGLAADPVRKTYWVYTDQSLFELVVGNEDRDVWKIYLDKTQFEVALRYAKVQGHMFCSLFLIPYIDRTSTRPNLDCASQRFF